MTAAAACTAIDCPSVLVKLIIKSSFQPLKELSVPRKARNDQSRAWKHTAEN